jgi:acyl-CoA reductase-like NAD-dependent aldehyde dehydrogenase
VRQNFVGGRFVDVEASNPIAVRNPSTGKIIADCPVTVQAGAQAIVGAVTPGIRGEV